MYSHLFDYLDNMALECRAASSREFLNRTPTFQMNKVAANSKPHLYLTLFQALAHRPKVGTRAQRETWLQMGSYMVVFLSVLATVRRDETA